MLLSGASGAEDARNSFLPSGSVRSRPLARCFPFLAGYPLTTISVPSGRESLLKPRRNSNCAGARDDVFDHSVIAFMASVFEQILRAFISRIIGAPWKDEGPWFCPDRWIIDGHDIIDRVGVHVKRLETCLSVKFVESTTSVLPSQCPRESPFHRRKLGSRCGRPSKAMSLTSCMLS